MPVLTFATLADVRRATTCEFAPWMAKLHHFVRLPSGRWVRTYGPPRDCLPRRQARVWESCWGFYGAEYAEDEGAAALAYLNEKHGCPIEETPTDIDGEHHADEE
jgi:hypothetical protein